MEHNPPFPFLKKQSKKAHDLEGQTVEEEVYQDIRREAFEECAEEISKITSDMQSVRKGGQKLCTVSLDFGTEM